VGSNPGWVKTEDDKIGICCFCVKHAALSSKSKDWLALNQDNVSTGCSFGEHSADLNIISLKINLPLYS
jgi:hypothetical protein